MRRRYSYLILLVALAAALVYSLTLATNSGSPLSEYFWWLIAAGGLIVTILLAMLIRYGWLLLRHNRHNMLGSRLTRRLALMFTLIAVLPGLFLFGVSAQFISYSINSWFGNDTAQALESSLTLSKSALDNTLDNTIEQAAALQVEIISRTSMGGTAAEALRLSGETARFSQVGLYNPADGTTELISNPAALPPPPAEKEVAEELQRHGSSRSVTNINGKLYAQGWLALPAAQEKGKALFFRRPIPDNVARDAELIENARSKYAELTYAKQGLQTFFLITLLAAALLSIMLALVIALYFARRFIEPILSLAEGAKAVAQGDFSQPRPVYRNDELGQLTRLFNHMTEQLAIAREAEELNRIRQEAARHYLETVLESLTAGVITLDETGRLKTLNRSAENILGLPLSELSGSNWHDWPQSVPQYLLLTELFQTILATEHTGKPVQTAYTGGDEARILLAKATPLPADNGGGTVLVFDDITLLVRAQKEAAWGEVAKRLAHEIRNPLTPIQLSAERLAWKLQDKLGEQDAQILARSTDTIIKQVAAMKEMVEAFRNYARAPALKLEKQDLNKIIEEVLLLYEAGACTFDAVFSNIPAVMYADTTAMRQVLHNIFKNAAEAAEEAAQPEVHIHTDNTDGKITLTVTNNGKSFSKDMLANAFEPYVTDKPTGTGLGLPVVKKIVEEHGGRIALSNPAEGGACVKITLPALVEEHYEK
ncbi:ATPase [Neisseria elongata subsp. glycolytica ATCC 29315]|uniref:histidine kinase n=1 Tax=Neisseria elongata subsp. glycolytica ATCC 29315 TaxID=546263 RepID=A0A0B5CRW6_NEIEG|nr:PAS domain-containing sensor histidine kinase [Neisseria elongata]AJE19031.1 ATPase [Neisseria elongata subsp. glycolytica ATCC 29315]SQH50932.1 two-component system sensor kinase [Neisseria elongata subsp. glycolytica]